MPYVANIVITVDEMCWGLGSGLASYDDMLNKLILVTSPVC